MNRKIVFILGGLALLLLLLAPVTKDMGLLNVLIKILIASVFALGFNLLWGQAGLLSFGHAAYFGIGTFATIYLMDSIDRGGSFPTPLVPLAGALAGFLFGLVAGWFATIRSGVYFAMITVALAELVSALSLKWEGLFGGEAGIRSVRTPWGPFTLQQTGDVYYFVLAWTAIVILFLLWLQNSPWGLVVRGIREREERVRFLGYNSHLTKTLVFAISTGISGLAGGLLAFSDEAANMVLFQGSGSTFVVLNTIIGGAGVFLGPVVGAALTTSFGYYIANISDYWLLYLGVIFIFIVIFAPQGLAGLVSARSSEVRRGVRAWISPLEAVRILGTASLFAGLVMIVEIVGHVLSAEYQAELAATGQWATISIFGLAWSPVSPATAIAVLLLFAIGALLVRFSLRGETIRLGGQVSRIFKPRSDP